MFKIQSESDRDATQVRYTQKGSVVIARLNSLNMTSLYQASKEALVEVNVSGIDNKDNPKLSRYLEYRLAEYLRQFVNLDKYPNLVLRFNLFILESTASIKSALANALTACVLLAGMSMWRTLVAVEYNEQREAYPQKISEELDWLAVDIYKQTLVEVDSRMGDPGKAPTGDVCRDFSQSLRRWLEGEYILIG